jgi:DNA-directed RNA polymerase sigma subunit (sigma70/sigma32)
MDDDFQERKLPQNNEGFMSQTEVALALGLSRNRVSEIEAKALRKFKYYLLKKYLKKDVI